MLGDFPSFNDREKFSVPWRLMSLGKGSYQGDSPLDFRVRLPPNET